MNLLVVVVVVIAATHAKMCFSLLFKLGAFSFLFRVFNKGYSNDGLFVLL